MAAYSYKGRNASGAVVKGNVEAGSVNAVASQLDIQGIVPLTITENKKGDDALGDLSSLLPPPKVESDELIIFCRQLYVLSKAGVPIVKALQGLLQSVDNPTLLKALRGVLRELDGGANLSAAMAGQPRVFTSIFVNMVRVGENTGNLDKAFIEIADYLQLEKENDKKVKQATRYPIMVVSSIGVAIAVINIWVVPSFAKVFASSKMELPLATKLLMTTSNFTVNYWWLILISVAVAVIATRSYLATKAGRLAWDKHKLKVPIMGTIFEKIAMTRFSNIFSMLLRSGVPMLQSLNIVSGIVGNEYISQQLRSMGSQIERGESLTAAAKNTGMFTPIVMQMLSVGEEAGAIEEMLDEVASLYREEVEFDLSRLSESIEPILLVFMGIMVMVLALGVFLPMWNMTDLAKG